MMQERVQFTSAGLKLAGMLELPEKRRDRHPAFLVLHGFGSNKDSAMMRAITSAEPPGGNGVTSLSGFDG